jgi:uncharacterized protein YdeI (YjbR/CyaY-like superfamily)
MEPRPTFFSSPDELRDWFEENHEKQTELWVGFFRKATGKQTMTWSEAVDQALCFGWIDGIRKGIDEESYMNRFTPRKPRSNWSAVNVAKVEALIKQGSMRPAGLAAFEKRQDERTAVYSYENRKDARFSREQAATFRANRKAWDFFAAQPPGYRMVATYWVVSAKKEETRVRRLARLIEDSEAGRRLAQLSPQPRKKG